MGPLPSGEARRYGDKTFKAMVSHNLSLIIQLCNAFNSHPLPRLISFSEFILDVCQGKNTGMEF